MAEVENVVDETVNKKKDFTFKDNEKVEVFKRKFKVIKDIAIGSTVDQLQDVNTFKWAAGIGLYQGLKYKGDLGQGMKAGVATVVVLTGSRIMGNVIQNIDAIRKA